MPYLAAIVSGLLAALAFPTIVSGVVFPQLFFLAWFALIPYLVTLNSRRLGTALGQTFLLGVFWNGLTSYWIFHALYFNGQLSWPASLGVLAFMAVGLSLLLAVFIGIALALHRRFGISQVILLPVAWTLYEWLRNYWPFGGYPWANLGYTQAAWPDLMQVADLFGVYGLSFLIVLANVALARSLPFLWKKSRSPWPALGVAATLILLGAGYGKYRLVAVERETLQVETLKVALLQPNIGQQHKDAPDLNVFILELLTQMTREAAGGGVQLVVWPETSLPTALPLEVKNYEPLSTFSVPLLLGVLSTQSLGAGTAPRLYNSALQVLPGGEFVGRVHKQHLVPLGEYVPLADWLWFIEPVVKKIGDFQSVAHDKLLKIHGRPYGVTICYEDLFPEISRKHTRQGARFLVNITNDAWYGDSSQLDQHLNFSRFRAVENRRSLVRATNTGYTAVIAPTGRLQAEIPKFTRSILLAEIPLMQDASFYTRWGDGPLLTTMLLILGLGFWLRPARGD